MTETGPQARPGRNSEVARLADLVVSGLFMLLGLYVCFVSVTKHQAFTQGQVGPGVLPFLIGATLVLTSALVALRLRHPAGGEDAEEMPTAREAGRAATLLGLIIVTVALMPVLGALVALGLFVLVETLVLEKRGWKLSVGTALLIPALLYIFFEAMLGVPLPAGMLGLL